VKRNLKETCNYRNIKYSV